MSQRPSSFDYLVDGWQQGEPMTLPGGYGNPMPPFGGGNPYMNMGGMPYGKGGGGGWGNPGPGQGGVWTPNLGIGPDGQRLPPVWHPSIGMPNPGHATGWGHDGRGGGPAQWRGGDGPGSPGYGKGKPQGRGGPDSGPTYPGAQPGPGGPMALPGGQPWVPIDTGFNLPIPEYLLQEDWQRAGYASQEDYFRDNPEAFAYWQKKQNSLQNPGPGPSNPGMPGPTGGQGSPRYGGPSYGPQMGQSDGVTVGGLGGAQPGPPGQIGNPNWIEYMGWGGPPKQIGYPTMPGQGYNPLLSPGQGGGQLGVQGPNQGGSWNNGGR